MPEHIMVFGPDERVELRDAIEGTSTRCALWQLEQEMRSCVKHDGAPCIAEDDEGAGLYNDTMIIAAEHWRDRLWAICDDYGIRLDEE